LISFAFAVSFIMPPIERNWICRFSCSSDRPLASKISLDQR